MPDDPNVVPKSAVLQSITAEANGFYGVVVTVASYLSRWELVVS